MQYRAVKSHNEKRMNPRLTRLAVNAQPIMFAPRAFYHASSITGSRRRSRKKWRCATHKNSDPLRCLHQFVVPLTPRSPARPALVSKSGQLCTPVIYCTLTVVTLPSYQGQRKRNV